MARSTHPNDTQSKLSTLILPYGPLVIVSSGLQYLVLHHTASEAGMSTLQMLALAVGVSFITVIVGAIMPLVLSALLDSPKRG